MVFFENWSVIRGMFSKERVYMFLLKFGLRVKGILVSIYFVEYVFVYYCKSFKIRFNKILFINIDVFVCFFFK